MLFLRGKWQVLGLLAVGIFSFFLFLFRTGDIVFSEPPPSETANLPLGLEIGMLAPDFTLQDINGTEIRLSECRGKGVILNFWSTWCKPCREELPLIESFYQDNKESKEVEVLSININREADDTVRDYIKSIGGLSFPVLMDRSKKVARRYSVHMLPISFILDNHS